MAGFQNLGKYHLLNARANLEEELVAGGVDMGRTWTSRTLWMPQARQLQSTETTIQMPIKKYRNHNSNANKKRKGKLTLKRIF